MDAKGSRPNGARGGYELEEAFRGTQQAVAIAENFAWTTLTLLLVRQATILIQCGQS